MFDKKEDQKETETRKEAIPEGIYREKESSGGKFVLNSEGNLVFLKTTQKQIFDNILHQWVKIKPTTEEIEIEKLGWFKEVTDNIVVRKDVPSRTEISGFDTLWFIQTLVYRVKPDPLFKHLYLKREESSHKVYLKNFRFGICYQCPHNSNTYITVETVETKPITKEKVLEMYKQGLISDVYSGFIEANGQKIYKKSVYVE